MEIDSQQPLSDHISNIQSQISAIVNSGQNTKYSFLQKALHLLEELRDLMNDREIEEYVSLFLFLSKHIELTNFLIKDSMNLADYEQQMHMHISLFDYTGAIALYERAQDRFKPEDVKKPNPITDSNLELLWYKVGAHMERYSLESMIEGLNELYERNPTQFK